MEKNKKAVLAAAALAAAAAVLLILWYLTRPEPQEGEKQIVIEVIHGDGREEKFSYQTDVEYLGELLTEKGLAEGTQGPYGLYITTVDGEIAQDSLRQWWAITKGGQRVDTGADATPIADGDCFELTMSTY